MSRASTILLAALGTGVAGWALENAFVGPRASALTPTLPFMPVYAAGGAAIALLAPHLGNVSPLGRGLAYGGVLTAVEGVAGVAERLDGRTSWDYGGSPIDVPHAVLWGALGLLIEPLVR